MKRRINKPKGHGNNVSQGWHSTFLVSFAATRNISASAVVAGVNRDTVLRHTKQFKAFGDAVRMLRVGFIDTMEANGIERATNGVKKPVYQQGVLVGYIQEYPESSMQFFLKANKKRYRKADEDSKEKAGPKERVPIQIILTDK